MGQVPSRHYFRGHQDLQSIAQAIQGAKSGLWRHSIDDLIKFVRETPERYLHSIISAQSEMSLIYTTHPLRGHEITLEVICLYSDQKKQQTQHSTWACCTATRSMHAWYIRQRHNGTSNVPTAKAIATPLKVASPGQLAASVATSI